MSGMPHGVGLVADEYISKTREALELYRAGAIKPVPIKTFDVSEITSAYRQFSQKNRVGKIVISMEKSQSIVKVRFPFTGPRFKLKRCESYRLFLRNTLPYSVLINPMS